MYVGGIIISPIPCTLTEVHFIHLLPGEAKGQGGPRGAHSKSQASVAICGHGCSCCGIGIDRGFQEEQEKAVTSILHFTFLY